ncbi:MAG: D-lyxose/D-mannose family sugar isomerase, partial [Casimicrobiaceae bacterium]
MKRSQINAAIARAQDALRAHDVRLPAYAYWSPRDWQSAGAEYGRVTRNGLGWAVTDFGQGDFDSIGITMFDVRNGNVDHPEEGTPYGEKIFVLQPGQRLPFHFHWKKTEDIISYHGGTLMIQLYN